VKNKLDGQEYAIKKIPVRYEISCFCLLELRVEAIILLLYFARSQDMLTKSIQKEVTVLASLHHPNIVKYHCAWLESIAPALSTNNVTIVEHRESQLEEHFEFSYYRNKELPSIPNNR
jgi:serine/threonine protein kinase